MKKPNIWNIHLFRLLLSIFLRSYLITIAMNTQLTSTDLEKINEAFQSSFAYGYRVRVSGTDGLVAWRNLV